LEILERLEKYQAEALLLWEGHAEITAYRRGNFIELAISSSELRSFLTGGLIGRSRAAAAREQLQQAVITILAPPPTREGLDSPSTRVEERRLHSIGQPLASELMGCTRA